MIRAHGTGIVEINVPTEASVGRSINRIKMEPVPHRLTVSDTSLVEAPRKWLRHTRVWVPGAVPSQWIIIISNKNKTGNQTKVTKAGATGACPP